MKVLTTKIKGLLIIEPTVYRDERGYFFESYNGTKLPDSISNLNWIQDNESKSKKGVLRGLHYQVEDAAQAKLVRAVVGEIYDVAVDLRPSSETYSHWFGIILSETNKKQVFIPRGFAHGFMVLSEEAIFSYRCDNSFSKESEGAIIYNDETLAIDWPLSSKDIITSSKDMNNPKFGQHRPIYTL